MAPKMKGISFLKRSQYICLDFKTYQGPKPVYSDYINFIFNDLKLKDDEIGGVGEHSHTNMYMFHIFSPEKYQEILQIVENGVPWASKGGSVIYGHSCDEYITTVRITNYDPFSMEIDDILANISQYGKILNHHNPCLPNHPSVTTNNIILKIKVEEGKQLPPVLYNSAHQEVLKLYFDGSERICHNCHGQGHTISWCKEKSVLAECGPQENTWAAIAAGKPKSNSRNRKNTPAAVKPRNNQPPAIIMNKEHFPDLSGNSNLDSTGNKAKTAAKQQTVEAFQITTKNKFDILSTDMMDDTPATEDNDEEIITDTQTETAEQPKEQASRGRRGRKGQGASPTGGQAPKNGDHEENFPPSLPSNQGGLLTPSTEESQHMQLGSLNLVYQGSIKSQDLRSQSLLTPESLRIESFQSIENTPQDLGTEHQSMGVQDSEDLDQLEDTQNSGDPGGLNPGETHLKRGLNRSNGLDSPQKKKPFKDQT